MRSTFGRSYPFGTRAVILLAVTFALHSPLAATDEELAPPPEQSEEDLAPPPGSADDELAPPPAPAEEELTPPPNVRRDQEPPAKPGDWANWDGVKELRGVNSVTDTFTKRRGSGSDQETAHHTMQADLTFRLVRDEHGDWKLAEGSVSGSDVEASSITSTWAQSEDSATANFSSPVDDVSVSISSKYGKWEFSTGGRTRVAYALQHESKSHAMHDLKWEDESSSSAKQTNTYRHIAMHGTLPPGKPSPIMATLEIPSGNPENGTSAVLRSSVMLTPVYEDVTLAVELSGPGRDGRKASYEQWIPAGTVSGGVGSKLNVKARLETPDGKPSKVEVKELAFRLKDTSREPGVCLNYPQNAAKRGSPAAPDLRFVAAGGENGKDLQEKFLPAGTDKDGYTSAETTIECIDWGAWSTLVVEATLADGRVVTGHLKGDPAAIAIALPKRTGGSHIAEAWKQQHQVTAPDDDDSEEIPAGGKAKGDGFTVYEEYRGFIEAGRHIEGDPKQIDFFVRNYIGADARPGIELFAEITGAVVHDKLRADEFDRKLRLMNGNYAEGAHHVDQHGVQMQTIAGTDGAATGFKPTGFRGRPVNCVGIDVQPREAETSLTTATNVPVSDRIFAYDIAIAHELLHSVGVEHHGKGDGKAVLEFVYPDDPDNLTGKPYLRFMNTTTPLVVTNEGSRRDFASQIEGDMTLLREKFRPLFYPHLLEEAVDFVKAREGYPNLPTPQEKADADFRMYFSLTFNFNWFVGTEHGECSGDENCVMRYFFATLYRKRGQPDAFYRIADSATEHLGTSLCRSPQGTGVNAPGRKPQPRYGDARAGCGDCAHWIVFNDAIPPDPEP